MLTHVDDVIKSLDWNYIWPLHIRKNDLPSDKPDLPWYDPSPSCCSIVHAVHTEEAKSRKSGFVWGTCQCCNWENEKRSSIHTFEPSIWILFGNDRETIILTREIAIHPRDQDYEDLALSVIGLNKTLKHKQKVDPSAIQNFNIRSF